MQKDNLKHENPTDANNVLAAAFSFNEAVVWDSHFGNYLPNGRKSL